MQDDVYECFECILERRLERRKTPKMEPMIDDYSGFLWFDKDGKPMVAMYWEKHFQYTVNKYNSIYKAHILDQLKE